MQRKQFDEEFKEYAYAVSHDLSAPVRAMVEFSKLLANEHSETLNEEGTEYLSIIIDSGKKLQTMMDGLLQYSRLNTTKKNFTHFSSQLVIENSLIAMADKITAKNAQVEISDQLPEIYGDMEQISQLFCYLLDNSLKFQKEDNLPFIEISAKENADFWIFSVSDNGIGIAPEYHNKVFKLFVRLHHEEEFAGIGMGLTLAQKVIDNHDGSIFCTSDGRQNCTFSFMIPKNTAILGIR